MEVNYFTILYWFCHTSTLIRHGHTRVPHPEPPSHLLPRTIQVIPVHQPQGSCIEPGLAIRFLYDIIQVSVSFPQIIPPSPSPTESKRLFYTSVSLLLSLIEGYHYHATPPAQFQKNKRPNQKMGLRTKQTFLQRRHTDG